MVYFRKSLFLFLTFFSLSSLGISRQLLRRITVDSLSWVGVIKYVKVLNYIPSGSRSRVNLVKDEKNTKFVVKQFKDIEFDIEFGIAREVLASLVGESVDIPLNKVRIIPTESKFPGKDDVNKPATVHTFASGVSVKKTPLNFFLSTRQKWEGTDRGLSRKVIESMAYHKDLPKIIAFDTFVSNVGRHRGNIFYDSITDRFTGIDLESSYRKPFDKNLSKIANENLSKMLKNNVKFSPQEIYALQEYKNTLEQLVLKNNPKKLHSLLDEIVKLANFNMSVFQKIYKTKITMPRYVNYYKKRITQQYVDTKKLIFVLEEILGRIH